MGDHSKEQQHCEIFPDAVTFKRLGMELESYGDPVMLIYEESATNDLIRRRMVSSLHMLERDIVEMRVPNGSFNAEELIRCCNIARESNVVIVLAYGLGVAAKYAHAISTCAWSERNPWRMYHDGRGLQPRKRIPYAHAFASLENYDEWEQVLDDFRRPKGAPDFAVQVTSVIY